MMDYFWNILASQGSFDLLALLALAAAKATLLLAFAAILCVAVRRRSAATRHLLWATALCASLLLPVLSFIKMWEVPILPSRMSVLSHPAATDITGNDVAFETPGMRVSGYATASPVAEEALPKALEFQTKAASHGEFTPVPSAPALQASSDSTATPLVP